MIFRIDPYVGACIAIHIVCDQHVPSDLTCNGRVPHDMEMNVLSTIHSTDLLKQMVWYEYPHRSGLSSEIELDNVCDNQ